ncbi:hypothetical protein SNE40_014925 [Patella caerulea]|uniref:Histone H4 n=1 Tax=Patella caerulea TaxID=87958 RepID=A0AAN8JFL9_PATCE
MVGAVHGQKGIGHGGAKRHRKLHCDNILGVNNESVRRFARRGGVKRICGLIYQTKRTIPQIFLEHVIRDAIAYAEEGHREVTSSDVKNALKTQIFVLCCAMFFKREELLGQRYYEENNNVSD